MSRFRAVFRALLFGGAAAPLPTSLATATGGMDTAYHGAPATFAYSGTRTDIYNMDTAYRGAPAIWAISA